MSGKAKIFNNGGSQAVRPPKSCRFPDDQREVVARKEGRGEWTPDFLEILGAWTKEIERPRSRKVAKRKDPFA